MQPRPDSSNVVPGPQDYLHPFERERIGRCAGDRCGRDMRASRTSRGSTVKPVQHRMIPCHEHSLAIVNYLVCP